MVWARLNVVNTEIDAVAEVAPLVGLTEVDRAAPPLSVETKLSVALRFLAGASTFLHIWGLRRQCEV